MNTTLQPPATKNITTPEQFFKEHAVKLKNSGLSRSAYCRKHQLNYGHFTYWLSKEKKATRHLVPVKLNQSTAVSSFSSIVAPVLCTLTLKNGSVLHIHDKGILPLILSALS